MLDALGSVKLKKDINVEYFVRTVTTTISQKSMKSIAQITNPSSGFERIEECFVVSSCF